MNRSPQGSSLPRLMIAEFLGTFLLILFGCGAVHAAVLSQAQQGIWQVAIVWGIAIMVAVYCVGAISSAHINPAVTIALAVWRGFRKAYVLPYIAAQVTGAFAAAAILYALFSPHLAAKEAEKGVVRGQPGSEITAMCYGEFFPNPGALATSPGRYSATQHAELKKLVTPAVAFLAELIGTAVLGFVVFAVSDERNPGRPTTTAPVFVGLTVAALISVIAPLTQACFNPARDFGPRVFSAFAGWNRVAFSGDLGWLTVYILAPILGAAVGGGIYELLIRPAFKKRAEGTVA